VLRELTVQNLALIEDAHVELHEGYCAWTGETGAGKSLLLTALGLVLGGKASADLVRTGKDEARAAALFDLSDRRLRRDIETVLGGSLDEDQLVLTRRISAQGRSSAQVNGLPVAVSTLRQLGDRLIDVHGQHEGRALANPAYQRSLLDTYGDVDALVATYDEGREAHRALLHRRRELIAAVERRGRERALLAFERDELTAADPRAGEYDELTREAHRLANAEQLRAATAEGYALLYEADRSAQELLERVARSLEPLTESVPELASAATDLGRLADETREVAYSLRQMGRDWEDDPQRLEEVEERLSLYRRLAGRFHCGPDDLAARRQEIEDQLAAIVRDDTDLAGLDRPLVDTWQSVTTAAASLSNARRKACKAFARAVQAQLKALSLGEARLAVEVTTEPLGDDPAAAPAPEGGVDRVEIVFAPNPGEAPRPLRKIASGGELSRVTLAIKTVLAEVDRVPTLIFDEIDAGVGGRLGAVLGRKLAELGRHHQIICVTHLPQMASFARHQWVIRKESARGRTRTTIEPLDEPRRVDELAAMLRGDSAAEGTRQEAQAMLAEARATQ
jgi:DNA repair protein RecN (Recombination protein N)